MVHVRAGKQKKQREVPLHPSTVRVLRDYARLRDARFPEPSTPAFFIGARGRRVPRGEFNRTFTQLVREVGLEGRGARVRPRPHDLRHALAVRTLLDWLDAGEDIDRRMPLLSAFLGHVDPASTYWYLEAVPELLELISRRLEQATGGALMTALAPALQAYFTEPSDHPAQLEPGDDRRLPRHVPAAACASRRSRPASSRSSWTSTISTRR